MKTICVFCSSGEVDKKYIDAAKELARLMVKNGYDLVWGGTNQGLMKVIADGVQNAGGKLFGVSVEIFKHKRRMNADEMIITKELPERKLLLIGKGDAIILLVGGVGSLDEISEVLELRKHNLHTKPVVILNTDNFYQGLKTQLERMEKDGFLPKKVEEFLYFAATPEEAIEYINQAIKN